MPTGVTARPVAGAQLEVSSAGGAGATGYYFSILPTGSAPPSSANGTGALVLGSTSYRVTSGLVSGTTYDIYVRTNCGAGIRSDWSTPLTYTFGCGSTISNIDLRPDLNVFYFQATGNPASYNFYRVPRGGAIAPGQAPVYSNSFSATGTISLIAPDNGEYDVYIEAVCGNGVAGPLFGPVAISGCTQPSFNPLGSVVCTDAGPVLTLRNISSRDETDFVFTTGVPGAVASYDLTTRLATITFPPNTSRGCRGHDCANGFSYLQEDQSLPSASTASSIWRHCPATPAPPRPPQSSTGRAVVSSSPSSTPPATSSLLSRPRPTSDLSPRASTATTAPSERANKHTPTATLPSRRPYRSPRARRPRSSCTSPTPKSRPSSPAGPSPRPPPSASTRSLAPVAVSPSRAGASSSRPPARRTVRTPGSTPSPSTISASSSPVVRRRPSR